MTNLMILNYTSTILYLHNIIFVQSYLKKCATFEKEVGVEGLYTTLEHHQHD